MCVRPLPLFLGMVCFFALMCEGVSAAKASRIELNDSTVYKDVEYDIDDVFKVITIVSGNSDRTVSFTTIRLILDRDGKDVTRDCLGRYYRGPMQPIEEARTADTIGRSTGGTITASKADEGNEKFRPYRMGIRLGGNISQPKGSWYGGTKDGFGFDGDLTLALDRHVALRLSLSKSGVAHDPLKLFGDVDILSDNLDWDIWRYFLSLQAYSWPDWRSDGHDMFYAYAGLGVVTHKLTGRAETYDPVTDSSSLWQGNGKIQTKGVLTAGCGNTTLIFGPVGAEYGASLDLVFVGGGSSGIAYLFDFKLGITYLVR
jgi:hypothetical protein